MKPLVPSLTPTPAAPLLTVRNLTVELAGRRQTLKPVDGISFSVAAGETFALVGESGCGKSMTALALMRLLPDAGRVKADGLTLAGADLLGLTEADMRQVRGGDIAMIFQEPATSLNPVMTVGAQIAEVLARRVKDKAAQRQQAAALLAAVGIPDPVRRLDEYPFRLSGGMKQRVMIAMALAGSPKLLVADEPTTALDVTIQAQVLGVLADLQAERGMAMVLITHDLGVVARMAHQVGVMYAGQLVEVAQRDDFFRHPRHPYARRLFASLPRPGQGRLETIAGNVPPLGTPFSGCRFAERCPEALARCHTEAPDWHEVSAAGHRVLCHLYQAGAPAPVALTAAAGAALPRAQAGASVMDVRQLQVHFPVRQGLLRRQVGQVKAVDGVSLNLKAGRTVALVGESGCGKTTVGKAMLRLIPPTGGVVLLDGEDLSQVSAARLRTLRAQMQMIFQDPYASLDPRMTVGDIIAEGMAALGLQQDTGPGRADRVAQLLDSVGLPAAMAARYPHEFSGGQRQRIAIARALAVAPRLLICDEPTSALDVSVQAQILNLLKELQSRLGLAYLFISHNLAVVEHLADEVAVMYLGRVVESGPADAVLRHARHPYTEALLSAVPSSELPDGQGQPGRPVIVLKGDMPSPLAPPHGCHFHPRCPKVLDVCRVAYPATTQLGPDHQVACHLY